MRVLLCSPNNGTIGGIYKWTKNIEEYYNSITQQREIDLRIFSISRKKRIDVQTSFLNRLFQGFLDFIPLIRKYRAIVKKNKYDVVHIASSGSLGLIRDILMLKEANRHKSTSLIHFHFGRIAEIFDKKNWEYQLLKIALKKADKIIVIDRNSFNTLINAGYLNVEFLPNPLILNAQRIIKENSEIKKIKRKILFVGHVIPTKGIFEFIKACKEIDNIKVKIIGSISISIEEKLIELAGPERSWMSIMGELDYEETIKEMLSADLFVLPSYTEGFPNVILESMACGCSIIATNVGAISEMLDIDGLQKSGVCIEPKNVHQLVNAIIKTFEDEELSTEYKKNAIRRVNCLYTTPIIWDKMLDIWTLSLK